MTCTICEISQIICIYIYIICEISQIIYIYTHTHFIKSFTTMYSMPANRQHYGNMKQVLPGLIQSVVAADGARLLVYNTMCHCGINYIKKTADVYLTSPSSGSKYF